MLLISLKWKGHYLPLVYCVVYNAITVGVILSILVRLLPIVRLIRKSPTFLLARDKTSVVGCTSTVTDGAEIDAGTSRYYSTVREINLIHSTTTDEVCLSGNDYDDLKSGWLQQSDWTFFLASSGNLWKDECSLLKERLWRTLVSGECKSFSQPEPPTPSRSASQNKIERKSRFLFNR